MISRELELKLWNLFNIAIRAAGYWFVVMSLGFLFCSAIMFIVSDVDSNSEFVVVGIILSIVLLVGGILMIKLKRYYPEHILKNVESKEKEKNLSKCG